MPRAPDPSRLRRILMQSIMWIILGATIGLAALVDHKRYSALNADLGEPRQFKAFSIRLPAAWTAPEESLNSKSLIEVREPYFGDEGRIISVMLKQPSIGEAIAVLTGADDGGEVKREESVPMGDTEGRLVVRRILKTHPLFEIKYPVTVITVSRMIGDKMLIIELDPQGGRSSRKELDRDVDLMKRIAASVKVNSEP
jgi:hypothetical protein